MLLTFQGGFGGAPRCHRAIFQTFFSLVFSTLFDVYTHGHSYLSQVHLVTLVFWFPHDQLRFIHDYTLLLLCFTYSSFTLFHSRNANSVSSSRYRIRLLLFDANERYLDFHSVLPSSDSDVGTPSRSSMARARTRLVRPNATDVMATCVRNISSITPNLSSVS